MKPNIAERIFIALLWFAGSTAALSAQNASEAFFPDHRFRLSGGIARAHVLPGILSETGPAWMVNSWVANENDRGETAKAVTAYEPETIHADTAGTELDYAFRDKFFIRLAHNETARKFNGAGAPVIHFGLVGNRRNFASYFEGARLLEYRERNTKLELAYLHPLFRGWSAGVFAGGESYFERNRTNPGSIVSKQAAANQSTFSENAEFGGNNRIEYRMNGRFAGPAFRFQLYDWLGFHYRAARVERSGTMASLGFSGIRKKNQNNKVERTSLLAHVGSALVRDHGTRQYFGVELTFLCRFFVTFGILREDLKRNYPLYLGNSFVPAERGLDEFDNQNKTPGGIGIGEMLFDHNMVKTEANLKLGIAVFL